MFLLFKRLTQLDCGFTLKYWTRLKGSPLKNYMKISFRTLTSVVNIIKHFICHVSSGQISYSVCHYDSSQPCMASLK
jgi:hypothetical protein